MYVNKLKLNLNYKLLTKFYFKRLKTSVAEIGIYWTDFQIQY